MGSAIAKVFGIAFLFLGILGFVPAARPGGYLLGVFDVNASCSLLYLLTALGALWAGHSGPHACRVYFFVAATVYSVVAILGFVMLDRPLFGLIANNLANAWLHLAFASLFIAFALMPESLREERGRDASGEPGR